MQNHDDIFFERLLRSAILKDEFKGISFESLKETAIKLYPELLKTAHGLTRDKDGRSLMRKRALIPIHLLRADDTSISPVNIMISLLLKGTYVRPHRHGSENSTDKNEYFYLMKGKMSVIEYDNDLNITKKWIFNKAHPIIHILPRTWHSLDCLSDNVLMLEFKDGPYDPKTDKEFHPKSPVER